MIIKTDQLQEVGTSTCIFVEINRGVAWGEEMGE
jgi:hypothetical protein